MASRNGALAALADEHRATIERLQNDIAMMERGDFRLWRRTAGTPDVEVTQEAIERDKATVRMLSDILDAIEKSEGL